MPSAVQLDWARHSLRLTRDRIDKPLFLDAAQVAHLKWRKNATERLLRAWAGEPVTLTPQERIYGQYLCAWADISEQRRQRALSDDLFSVKAAALRARLVKRIGANYHD